MGSRRGCEDLIRAKRVRVNGEIAELGSKVDPTTDIITVDGKRITFPQKHTYVLLYKPQGVVSTVKDPQGRPKVIDLVSIPGVRLFPVGRLDYQTSGLLLLTDDGELTYLLTHPKFGVWKTYHAFVQGTPSQEALKRMREGLPLEDGRTSPARVRLVGKGHQKNSILEISLHEGRKRQVRRMCEFIGHPVLELERKRFAFLNLGGLQSGEYRFLSPDEVHRLKKLALGDQGGRKPHLSRENKQ